jgi:hypothetical protein
MNENQTEGKEQVSQDVLEAIVKLAHTGSTPEAICFFLGLSLQTVQQIIANDPMHRARVVQSIKERSADYRCTLSKRLMVRPVMTSDGNFYEQSILEAHPSLSREQIMPSPKLKAKIADFSKDSLKELEGYLRQKDPQEDVLELIAECLSVLSPDAGMESALRVLGKVEGEAVGKLIGKLRGLVPEEMLLSLMIQTAKELPSHSLNLAALIILEPRSERAFEEAFRLFTELLRQVDLSAGAINLAEKVSERLSSSRLRQMNAALEARPREGGDILDGLRLKEANLLMREGEVEAAIRLVNTLRISPSMEKEVLRFYDEAGLSSEKVPILEQRLSAKLEEISRDSPSLAEAFSLFHQLLKAEHHSHKPDGVDQPLIRLKAEVLDETLTKLGQMTSHALKPQDSRIQRLEEQSQRKETDYQKTLVSLRAEIKALTEELAKAKEEISQVKRAQDKQQQRSDTATQESLTRLREELRTLHEQTARSGEEAKHFQSFKERSLKAETATQQALSGLKGEVGVLSKNLDQVTSQCKKAQSAQDQKLEAQSKTVANALNSLRGELTETKQLLHDTKETLNTLQAQQLHEDTLPTFIYSYKKDTDQLHRTKLVTGEQSKHRVPSYRFKPFCCLSEVPGGGLLITGGENEDLSAVWEVVRVDVGTFEVFREPHMLTPRSCHAAVYHTPHLYVLGGTTGSRLLSECERYEFAENRWEELPPLPTACRGLSGVVIESSLYALGGRSDGSPLDLVQRLSLEWLTWEVMQLRLPFADSSIPCFKLRGTEVYLVVNKTLCSFTALEVRPLKTLAKDIGSWYGASYYNRGTLYCTTFKGAVRSLEIGSLSSSL